MKFRNFYIIITITLSFLGSAACKSHKDIIVSKPENPEKHLAVTALFIDAKRAVFNGNNSQAVELFEKVLKQDPQNHAACYELSRLLPKTDINAAINYGESSVKMDPSNKWYIINLADLYSYAGEVDKAAKTVNKLIELQPDNINNYYRLVNIYLKKPDYNNALKTYYRIEKRFGFDEKNCLRRKDIYFKTGNYKKAEKEMQMLIDYNPGEKRYYGIMADILMREGKTSKALDYYRKILEIDPSDGKVHLVLAGYYNSIGEKKMSFEEMKKAFSNKSVDIDSKIKVMLKYYKLTADFPQELFLKSQADTLLSILEKTHPGNPKALAVKGDFLVRDKKWNKAESAYNQVIAVDSSKYVIWEQLILIAREKGDYEKMRNYSSRALMMFPQYPIIYYFNAVSDYHLEDYKEADAVLTLGLSFVYKAEQKAEFYTLSGIVRDSLQRYKEAEISYERALMAVPNDTNALRAFALHYVLINKELEKAESYAKKCLELNYKSAENHYVYAKVLFAQNKTKEALIWAKKGLSINPENTNLNRLTAEILLDEGNKAEAEKYLKKIRR